MTSKRFDVCAISIGELENANRPFLLFLPFGSFGDIVFGFARTTAFPFTSVSTISVTLLQTFLLLVLVTRVHCLSMSTESVRGVWQRQFEEDPIGDVENADRDTLVFWTQAPQSGIYVDIRLPKGSLGRKDRVQQVDKDPSALQARGGMHDDTSLSIEAKALLLRQKSFAGRLTFSLGDTTTSKEALAKDDILSELAKQAAIDTNGGALPLCTCFWKREIDYQPPSGGLDIGVCASAPPNSDGSIDLRETGDDGSYAEGWHRLVGSEHGPYFACELQTENEMERTGYWVRTGKYFAYAIGRPKDESTAEKLGCAPKSAHIQNCIGKPLINAVSDLDLDNKTTLSVIGTYVCVFGEVVDAKWEILHSTDPRLVGCNLVGTEPESCSTLSLEQGCEFQEGSILCQKATGSDGFRRMWKVIEVDDGNAVVQSLSLDK